MRTILPFIGVIMLLGQPGVQAQEVVFANKKSASGGTGQSWGTAFNDLQDALAIAKSLAASGAEVQVWVASGIYKPDSGTSDRSHSFQLSTNVAVYGGFAGHETQLSARDVTSNITVLSGDLLDNDPPATVNVADPLLSDNSVHVVDGSGAGSTAVLDGFTVSGGVAYVQGGTMLDSLGGAIYIENGSPFVRQCIFSGNLASSEGGAVYAWLASSPVFEICAFQGNYAYKGGALSQRESGVLTLRDCEFKQNSTATEGGAVVFNGVKIVAEGCSFVGNTAKYGAAVFDYGFVGEYSECIFDTNTAIAGSVMMIKSTVRSSFKSCDFINNRTSTGAMRFDETTNTFVLSESLFEGNVSTGGGAALYIRRASGTVSNSEFRENIAAGHGGAIYCDYSGVTIEACLFEKNSAVGTGGAIKASPVESISDCTFIENTAISGGAVWIDYGECNNSLFKRNIATARGGAVHCENDVDFDNCTFLSNEADSGGAMSLDRYANPTITRSHFRGNAAATKGGAISAKHLALPREFTIEDSVFAANTAANGGAIHGDGSNPVLSRCQFEENIASDSGGAIFNVLSKISLVHSSFVMNVATHRGGALFSDQNSDAALTNCLLVGNRAEIGGGVATVQFSDLHAINCTVVANMASDVGGGLSLVDSGEALLRNSILWGNSDKTGMGEDAQVHLDTGALAMPRYSCIEGWTGSMGGVGNRGDSPAFHNEYGPDGLPGTGDEDLRLNSGSPCVDAGENSAFPAALILDLDKLIRFVDEPFTANTGSGTAPHIDLGVYEVQLGGCYADCDKSTGVGVLDIFDFLCFQRSFVAGHAFACDCDVTTGVGVCDIFDFLCFQSAFTTGCP